MALVSLPPLGWGRGELQSGAIIGEDTSREQYQRLHQRDLSL